MSDQSVSLVDRASGARADILVGLGFNCFRWTIADVLQGANLLWAPPGFEDGSQRASSGGIPVLCPFPGRIGGAVFDWKGAAYQLEPADGRGNAIHGFVHTRGWQIVEQTDQAITAEFSAARQAPELLQLWPTDFCIRGTYRLNGHRLESAFLIHNPGEVPLPGGLGLHPYFRVTENSVVRLQVDKQWELVDLLPTGARHPAPVAAALAEGMRMSDMQFDDVFSLAAGASAASISDDEGTLQIQWNDAFPLAVIYTPPHREALCIEPYSMVPDAFRLEQMGIETGLAIVAPDEQRRFEMQLEWCG